jgi:hypothetical protein
LNTVVNKSAIVFPEKIISTITNPCILSVLMLLVVFSTKSNQLLRLAEWCITLFLLLVVFPLVYIHSRTSFNQGIKSIRVDPTQFLKRHPRDILILGIVCGLPCWAILKYLDAPSIALYTLMALLVVAAIIALINLFFRASFHLASVTVMVYVTVVTWGPLFLVFLFLIPLIGWAKYRLHQHNPVQMMVGIALAVITTPIVIYCLS